MFAYLLGENDSINFVNKLVQIMVEPIVTQDESEKHQLSKYISMPFVYLTKLYIF